MPAINVTTKFLKEAEEFFEIKLRSFLKEHASNVDEIELDFSFYHLTSSPFSCVCKVLVEGWIYGEPYSKRTEASRSPWGEILFFFIPGTLFFTLFVEFINFFTRRRTGEVKESNLVFRCVDTVSDKLLIKLIKKVDLSPSRRVKYWLFLSKLSWFFTFLYFVTTAAVVNSFMDPFAGMFWNDLIFCAAMATLLSFFFYWAMRCFAPICISKRFFLEETEGQLYMKLAKIKPILLMKAACMLLFFIFLTISGFPYFLLAIKP